jgi:glyoxylase-like metal-dependent hydrolase (beta-lactamase superfamily II)/ferredoxin
VDSTCINCDTCRQLAPSTFLEQQEHAAVQNQPVQEQEHFKAYRALLACPVGSIGAQQQDTSLLHQAKESFPQQLDGDVFYNGFNSDKSFGANSYFIRHPEGNWLIDSPRFLGHLVKAFQTMGGIRYIFLTHEDDIADAEKYARHFQAKRLIHQADAGAVPDAEIIVNGDAPIEKASGFHLIPVPGHTPGSMALLYHNKYLFTGDHLWWDREGQRLQSPCVYIWNERLLLNSIQRLLPYEIEWVLPGHGDRVSLPSPMMKKELQKLLHQRKHVRA